MRFRGGGVGHKSTREATDFFKDDRDVLDASREAPEEPVIEVVTETLEENGEDDEDEGSIDEEEGGDKDEEDDFGIAREQAVYSEDSEDEESEEEVIEEDFGPEGDGTGQDPDMEALGYDQL